MTTQVRREDADGVVTVTFTRDEKRNAVDLVMWAAIEQAVQDLAENNDLRVLVLAAEGKWYTSGMDITTLHVDVGKDENGIVRGKNLRREYRANAHHDLFDFIEQIEKPVILAAQGHCFGVGVEMGASCDFRLASDVATFALPEVANLSVIPASGGISRLTRLVGPHWARWMAMAGETVDAETARMMAFVHAVYPLAEFPERVQAFARKLAALPQEALGLAKLSIETAASVDRRSARDFDRLAQTALFQSHDFGERVRAFTSRASGGGGGGTGAKS